MDDRLRCLNSTGDRCRAVIRLHRVGCCDHQPGRRYVNHLVAADERVIGGEAGIGPCAVDQRQPACIHLLAGSNIAVGDGACARKAERLAPGQGTYPQRGGIYSRAAVIDPRACQIDHERRDGARAGGCRSRWQELIVRQVTRDRNAGNGNRLSCAGIGSVKARVGEIHRDRIASGDVGGKTYRRARQPIIGLGSDDRREAQHSARNISKSRWIGRQDVIAAIGPAQAGDRDAYKLVGTDVFVEE